MTVLLVIITKNYIWENVLILVLTIHFKIIKMNVSLVMKLVTVVGHKAIMDVKHVKLDIRNMVDYVLKMIVCQDSIYINKAVK